MVFRGRNSLEEAGMVIFRLLVIIIFIAVPGASPAWAQTGFQVSPDRFDIQASAGTTIQRTLHIHNNQGETARFQIDIEEPEFGDLFQFEDSDFSLSGYESKTINFTMKSLPAETDDYMVHIRVLSLSDSSGINIGTGIKIPINIQLSQNEPGVGSESQESSDPNYYIYVLVAAVILAIIPVVFYIRKRLTKPLTGGN